MSSINVDSMFDVFSLVREGFEFSFQPSFSNKQVYVSSYYVRKSGGKTLMYQGDNLDHAIASCQLYLESID